MIELRVINGEPDAERRSCSDCRHCKAAINWWCTNEKAVKYRRTNIPDVYLCHFWEPALKLEPWYKRLFNLNPFEQPILIDCEKPKKLREEKG